MHDDRHTIEPTKSCLIIYWFARNTLQPPICLYCKSDIICCCLFWVIFQSLLKMLWKSL